MDKARENLIKFFASLLVGYSPVAPGTLGTLTGVLFYFILNPKGIKIYILVTLFLFASGVKISSLAEIIFKEHDSPRIIIDEVAGFFVTMLFVPFNILFIISGFILFRIFDIWKPAPISHLQKLPGGIGIMADDLMAGIYSNLILQVITRLSI